MMIPSSGKLLSAEQTKCLSAMSKPNRLQKIAEIARHMRAVAQMSSPLPWYVARYFP
jgi:hypothetical protein